MKTIPLTGHVGKDGTLDLKVQTGLAESDVDVVVTIQPKGRAGKWPEGFIEETYGCFADDPIERPPQLPVEVREALD
jgi:hypothetical protein